jgi:hypothetical protein
MFTQLDPVSHLPSTRPARSRRLALLGLLACLPACLPACSGGGGGGGGTPAPTGPTAVFSGTWSITEETLTATSVCAPEVGTMQTYPVTVTQSGTTISVQTPVGTFSGTVSGNTLSWTGQYPEDGGIATITSLQVQVSGSSLSGTSAFSWTDGVDACAGTTSITGVRTAPATAGPDAGASGGAELCSFAQEPKDGRFAPFVRTLWIESGQDGVHVARADGTAGVRAEGDLRAWRATWREEFDDGAVWTEELEIELAGRAQRVGRSSWRVELPDGRVLEGVDELTSLPFAVGGKAGDRAVEPVDRYVPTTR